MFTENLKIKKAIKCWGNVAIENYTLRVTRFTKYETKFLNNLKITVKYIKFSGILFPENSVANFLWYFYCLRKN